MKSLSFSFKKKQKKTFHKTKEFHQNRFSLPLSLSKGERTRLSQISGVASSWPTSWSSWLVGTGETVLLSSEQNGKGVKKREKGNATFFRFRFRLG